MVVEVPAQGPMMTAAYPIYDPEGPKWPEKVNLAYESASGAIGTLVSVFVNGPAGTLSPAPAWHAFAQEHPVEAGVVTAHVEATSVNPLQALYQMVLRRVDSGYDALRSDHGPTVTVVVDCPKCGASFAPWGHMRGVPPPESDHYRL
jgi:hypothetical protein